MFNDEARTHRGTRTSSSRLARWFDGKFVTPVDDKAGNSSLVAWQLNRRGHRVATVNGHILKLAANSVGERIAALVGGASVTEPLGGGMVISKSSDETVEVVTIDAGHQPQVVFGGAQAREARVSESDKIVWDPRGRYLAFGFDDTRIVEIESKKLALDEPRDGGPMQWDPDGLLLGSVENISKHGHFIYATGRWDAPRGEAREEKQPRLWSPDQRFSIRICDSAVTIGQPGREERTITFSRPEDLEALGNVMDGLYEGQLAWLGGHSLILEGDSTMVLDLETGQLRYIFPDDDTIFVSASPDGRYVIGQRHGPDEYVIGEITQGVPRVGSALAHPELEDVQEALERLLTRHTDDDYVIIEVRGADAFVQFGAGKNLVLDVPLAALNTEQEARAKTAFGKLGVSKPTRHAADGSTHASYTHDFGSDVSTAAQVALDILTTVYRTRSNTSLVIEEQ